MFKFAPAFFILVPSLAFGADTYKCLAKEDGVSFAADLVINATTADIIISSAGLPDCRSVPSMTITGQKPVLTLTGPVSCDGEDPEEISMVLNTSKKTLSLGETVFSCK